MSRTISRLSPITPYGLDVPFTGFSAAAHANYKFNYISDRGTASMKFFDHPVYIHTHGVVRMPKDAYGKTVFSINPEEASFVRTVETDIMQQLERVIGMAEPGVNITSLPLKSITYENLVKLRINKTVGQDLEGKLVEHEKHAEVLEKGVKVLMTLEIHGLYHSDVSRGVIARVHCYRVVESF
jgi:hypothetical protein